MNRQSQADQRIVDRLNAELSLIAIPARGASRTAPKSGLRTAAFLTAALAVLILAIGGFRTLREVPSGSAASSTEPQRTAPIVRASAVEGSRTGPVTTSDLVARLNAAGLASQIAPPAPSRLLLFNATDEDLVTVDEAAIKAFVVYRYPSVAAATSAFRLDAVQDPGRGTVSYIAKPYFVGTGDALVVFATNDEALARRVIAALVP